MSQATLAQDLKDINADCISPGLTPDQYAEDLATAIVAEVESSNVNFSEDRTNLKIDTIGPFAGTDPDLISLTDGNVQINGNLKDSGGVNYPTASDLSGHVDATSVHGAVSEATADRLILRDAAGRAQVADPSVDADIATKGYVDAAAASSIYEPAMTNHGTSVTTSVTAPAGVVGKMCILMGYGRKSSTEQTVTVSLGTGSYIVAAAHIAQGNLTTNLVWTDKTMTVAGSTTYNAKTGRTGSLITETIYASNYFKYYILAYRIS